MIFYILLIPIMTLTASFASFSLKKSTTAGTVVSIITNKFLYIGGLLYVMSALLNILLLKKMPFSIVVPLGSICYIWTLIIARFFLNEKIGIWKILGISLIIIGIFLITLKPSYY